MSDADVGVGNFYVGYPFVCGSCVDVVVCGVCFVFGHSGDILRCIFQDVLEYRCVHAMLITSGWW